jgi:hypothetical protein
MLALIAPWPVTAQQPPSGAPPAAPVPPPAEAEGPPPFTPEQLEQIAAPVALYPDPLLAQVLMASTYPLEVVQAARFMKDNPNIQGDKLNEALKEQTWDESVKSLLSFPQALSLMDQKLEWTQKLGDAVLDQQKDLMAAIQRLRAKAQAEGNLKSTSEQTVTVEPAPPAPPDQAGAAAPTSTIVIQPTDPQVVYVPSYNPTVVYGAWPYPAYPPYYPYPPGYAFGAAALSFGIGMAVGGALWGNCNWGGGDVDIDVNKNNNFTRNVNKPDRANDRMNRQGQGGDRAGDRGGGRSQWKHSPENRKGVQYRDKGTQQRYDRAGQGGAQSRDAYRGRDQGGRGGAQGSPRASTRDAGAFQGAGSGRDAKSFSDRGAGSRQSMGGGSRGGGSSFGSAGGGGGRQSMGAGGGGGGGGRGGGGGGGGRGGGGGGGGGRGGGRR